jgi:hypothetical protein
MDVEENRASVDNSKTDSQMDLPKATKTNKNVKKETHFCRWCCSHLINSEFKACSPTKKLGTTSWRSIFDYRSIVL